jgi:hypothetical protein
MLISNIKIYLLLTIYLFPYSLTIWFIYTYMIIVFSGTYMLRKNIFATCGFVKVHVLGIPADFRRMKKMAKDVIGSVLVVGGGIAGMQSALDLANSGYYVYLLEKSPSIGGIMSQLDKTFPTNDCAM